jgi:hypothetical protein
MFDHFRDKERIKGFLIGKQDAFLPVEPKQVGIPVAQSFRIRGDFFCLGNISLEYFQEFLGAVDDSHG